VTDLATLLRSSRWVLSDGAIGTMLQGRGLAVGASPELWNLTHPGEVRAVHDEYVRAGSQLITTNTFGGSRRKLSKFDAAERFQDANTAAVRLAREAADGRALVMGSIGPLGDLMEPYGDLTDQEAADEYGALAAVIARAGADAILFETFFDLNELIVAVRAASAAGLPILATMTFDESGRTMMGNTPGDAWSAVSDLGLVAFGANCSTGPDRMVPVIAQMNAAGAPVLMAQPNAGMPEVTAEGQLRYLEGPESFAAHVPALLQAGCRVFGGCCGTTPEHIRALRRNLEAAAPA
jgi:5-methyltetrahydrofolate--homocysteine methyltransferase